MLGVFLTFKLILLADAIRFLQEVSWYTVVLSRSFFTRNIWSSKTTGFVGRTLGFSALNIVQISSSVTFVFVGRTSNCQQLLSKFQVWLTATSRLLHRISHFHPFQHPLKICTAPSSEFVVGTSHYPNLSNSSVVQFSFPVMSGLVSRMSHCPVISACATLNNVSQQCLDLLTGCRTEQFFQPLPQFGFAF